MKTFGKVLVVTLSVVTVVGGFLCAVYFWNLDTVVKDWFAARAEKRRSAKEEEEDLVF